MAQAALKRVGGIFLTIGSGQDCWSARAHLLEPVFRAPFPGSSPACLRFRFFCSARCS